MKSKWITVTTVIVTLFVVAGLATAGWWFVGRNVGSSTVLAQGPGGKAVGNMMPGSVTSTACFLPASQATAGQPLTIQQAKEAADRYLANLGDSNLKVAEVMEFSRNFYALVRESYTGTGAIELLVDKGSGAVGPEYGPNMMWNAKYGMHRSGMMGLMMGGTIAGEMTVTPDETRQIAQRWLDTYRPGTTPEPEIDVFYGYYTIHTLKDGKINGMLSINGSNGQVWDHTWHGDFIQLLAVEK
ncbi:MAG: hypothetical protein ACYCZF_03655 [Anaerolineae bacterium]